MGCYNPNTFVATFLSMAGGRRALHRELVQRVHARYGDVPAAIVPSGALVE